MATVLDLLHSTRKDAVMASLAMTYTGAGEDPEGYSQMWDTLLTLQPTPTDVACALTPITSKCGSRIDVSGLSEDGVYYAIEFTEWSQWLSMEVVLAAALEDMSSVEQLCHILAEIAWGGYEQEAQREHLDIIEERLEDVKSGLGIGSLFDEDDKPTN